MTEVEWLTVTEPQLQALLNKQTDLRKLRLFALSCLPVMSKYIWDPRLKTAVGVLTEAVDGRASATALRDTLYSGRDVIVEIIHDASEQRWHYVSLFAAQAAVLAVEEEPIQIAAVAKYCLDALSTAASANATDAVRREEHERHVARFRDIFGNPFRPVAFEPRWRSETAVTLAAAIYEERAFDRMPILADALEEAGCDHADILTHCRSDGPHVRGCWVVDLVLGKS